MESLFRVSQNKSIALRTYTYFAYCYGIDAMKDIDEIRRENMHLIESEAGGTTEAATLCGMSPSQFANLRDGAKDSKTGKPRGMRKETARRIEKCAKKPAGWLDTDHSVEPPAGAITYGMTKVREVPVVGKGSGGAMPERIWTDGDYPVGETGECADIATNDQHAFLVAVEGSSMIPRYNPSEFALVEPGTEPEIEDDVLVRLASGETMIKRLLSRRGGWRFGSYNNQEVLHYTSEEVTWVYYVAHPVPRRKIKSRC